MASQIHYEIFRRVGAKGGWTLHDVRDARDSAMTLAQELMAQEKATGVKVVKETYNDDTGDYLTLKIFEDGHNQVKVAAAQEDAPHALPCFKPDDLYSYHARATMTRLLTDFLARNKITITELIHRADMLEKLEATGTLYQHAVQKIAVAQAASTTTPVQQIVKSLNELTTQAFHRVYRDQRKGLFPDPQPGQFAVLAERLVVRPEAGYLFNGALARHLKDAQGWDEKVLMLITAMETAPTEEAPRKLVLSSVDAILAEILNGSAALHELMGKSENLAGALNNLVALFLGKAGPDAKSGAAAEAANKKGLTALTHHFAADDLPEARMAVAHRILAEIKSNRRLCPDFMVDELKSLRAIANKLVMGVGKYLSHEDLVAGFTLRSKRLVAQEALGQYIAEAQPDEKLERILFVEDNIIGSENKRQLASYIAPILNSAAFENHFHNPKSPLLGRLQKLAQLQTRMRRSGFIEVTREEICARLDGLAVQMEARGKLFDTIEARSASPVEKAQTLLRLATSGILTEGQLSARARELILGYLSCPGFLTGYMAAQAGEGEPPDTEKVMTELMETLGKAGITAETGLRSIAA
ncbi:MAG TPA: hypothetical protein VG821_10660 [Rhizomicrobium sp.]|jgi:hypothetical protein|nr:hypothetical protein [Rhizomicrobium sp.]